MAFKPSEHLISLKGKQYLQVAWRLVWLREEHPDWSIRTEIVEHDENHAIFNAQIVEPMTEHIIAEAHGSETKRDFGDFLEKAETKAVGRALAMCGYGTQFTADELDEGQRIVDSPLPIKAREDEKKPVEAPAEQYVCKRCGCDIVERTVDGKVITPEEIVNISRRRHKDIYCCECMAAMKKKPEGETK